MTKKYIFVILIIVIASTTYFKNGDKQNPILIFTDSVKSFYLSVVSKISEDINGFIYAIDKIYFEANKYKLLQQKIKQLEEFKTLVLAASDELNNILSIYKFNSFNPRLKAVKVISLANFEDPYKLWIDYKDFNSSRVYGLINKNHIAGILISKNNRPLALLNHDIKCSYTVIIGKNKAPGITKGLRDENKILVDYIPEYIDIKIGDEVFTSGLDNIFFSGIKVGKVIKIKKSQGYKKAFVKLHNNDLYMKYLYVVEKTR